MRKAMKRILAAVLASTMAFSLAACNSAPLEGDSSLRGQNVRVVIGSTSTSGDSYMIADLVTRYLSKEMGFRGKVDAVGNAEALDVIVNNAKGDGTTIMMFHDMTFLSVLFRAFGSLSDRFDLDNMTIGPRIGQNPGACFGAAAEDNWHSLADVEQYMLDNPDAIISCNIESGSTSHLAFVAWYLSVKEKYGEDVSNRITAIVGGTTAEKLQRLWDRNAKIIYGDTSAFEQYTLDDVDPQLKMTMFGSGGKVEGVDITSMAEEGVVFNGKPFEFAKDFCMYFPKDMDPDVLAEYEAAMKKVTEDPAFIADMKKLYYTPLSADEVGVDVSREFIYNKREMCKELIDAAPSLDELTR